MAFALDEASQRRIKQVRDFLHDYTRLRWTIVAVYAFLAVLVWWNLGSEIDRLRTKVGAEKHRQALIAELRVQKKFSDGLTAYLPAPEGHDLSWWLDQFSTAAQKASVQLDKSLPKPGATRLGPYPICSFTIEAVGSYQGIVRFVDNVENIKPLAKIERVDVEELVGEAARLVTVDLLPGERRVVITLTVLMSPKAQ